MTFAILTRVHWQKSLIQLLAIFGVAALCVLSTIVNCAFSQDPAQVSREGFFVEQKEGLILIHLNGKPLGNYVYRDPAILRPYFCNLRIGSGTNITRNHPPVEGVDAVDHATMHPGIWLAFGDINGFDFWRNKATIQHDRFTVQPNTSTQDLRFSSTSSLIAPEGRTIGTVESNLRLNLVQGGVLLIWQADLQPHNHPLVFGDQEEMGFGVRLATELTEKNGGLITSSNSSRSAKETWGQAAQWCDYSKTIHDQDVGITVMASPQNFRASWWHNRDYGLMVANPFGRAAMKQGEPSKVEVRIGETLRIEFAAIIHEHSNYLPAEGYQKYLQLRTIDQ